MKTTRFFLRACVLCLVLFAAATGALAQDEPITLEFWFLSSGPENNAQMERAIDRFEALYPNVTVNMTPYTFDEMIRTLPLALDGGTGPDVLYVNPLSQGSDRYAKAGHLVELTDIAEERGWTDTFPMSIIAYNNQGTPEQIFGIPFSTLTVGAYYNREIFDQLGLEVPTTLEEFDQVVEALKAAGIQPISVGGRTGWPLEHDWSQLTHTNIDINHIARLEQLDPDVGYDAPEMIEAAAVFQNWCLNGYFNEGFLATSYQEANDLFINQEVAMNIGGSWAAPEFEAADFEVGFFPIPQMNTDLPWHAGGQAPSDNLTVTVYAQHPEMAIEFINYLLSEDNMTHFWEEGTLVIYQFEDQPAPQTALQQDMYDAMQIRGPGYYMGVVNGEVNRTIFAQLQNLCAGDVTPEEAMQNIQVVYAEQAALAAESMDAEGDA